MFVPVPLQVAYVNLISVFWNAYLSYMKFDAELDKEGIENKNSSNSGNESGYSGIEGGNNIDNKGITQGATHHDNASHKTLSLIETHHSIIEAGLQST